MMMQDSPEEREFKSWMIAVPSRLSIAGMGFPEITIDDTKIIFGSDQFAIRCHWSQHAPDLYEMLRCWNNDETADKGFYIYGDSGVGKTTFLKTKALQMSLLNPDVEHFVKYINLSRAFKEMRENDFANRKIFLQRILQARHLFIDDIGTEKESDWKESELLDILDFRLMHKSQRWTYFASNLLPEDLKYSVRISRRIRDIAEPIRVGINPS